jgi:hypothetical protein
MREKTRAIRPEVEARNVVAVTESLPNLKRSRPPKKVEALEASVHAAFKAFERQKPCVVMKHTE